MSGIDVHGLPRVKIGCGIGQLLRYFGGDLASGGLFVYVSFVFVAQIKFQVEDYLCRHTYFTNTQIEFGHFVMCKCSSV
jgi:hypothetical protein